jgi:hypothetical protein
MGFVALVVGLSLVLATPLDTTAMETDGCSHDPTVAALRTCVLHATEHGHIDNTGVARALLARVDAAAHALAAERVASAANALESFIVFVNVQSGKHIDGEHAAHLRMHAEAVVAALSG